MWLRRAYKLLQKVCEELSKNGFPINSSTKNNAFVSNETTIQAFSSLKESMCTTPVLVVTNFTKSFVVKCDASSRGLGVILMQGEHRLVFTSKKLCGRNLGKYYTYDKEMMSILHAVETWQPYLIRKHFQIKTKHHSLKYFLEQRFSSSKQNKWVTNILGYDYDIIYKMGKENVVENALFGKYEEDGSLFTLSSLVPEWFTEA